VKINIFVKLMMSFSLILMTGFWEAGSASAANGPFVCSSNFYQVISGQLNVLDPATGTYTSIGGQQADYYNGIGYNVLDNYIYGFKTSVTDNVGAVGDLVRIASDGTMTDLGPVSGMTPASYVNGSFDLAGNLYVRAGNNSIYKVNVATVSATTITTTGNSITSGLDNVFINNKLYLLSGTTLSVVDLSNNSVTNQTVNGPSGWQNAGGSFGAGWTDNAGELFFSNNGDGTIYQITGFDTGSPTATFKVAGTVTGNNDGASCPLATQNPFQAPIANNDTYASASNSTNRQISGSVLTNDMGNGLSVTSNTNPAHGSVVVNANGTFVYTPDPDFNGNDSFNYTVTDTFGRTSTATVTLSVSPDVVPATTGPDTGFGVRFDNYDIAIGAIIGALITATLAWRIRRPAD
jgi:hypothetical protein